MDIEGSEFLGFFQHFQWKSCTLNPYKSSVFTSNKCLKLFADHSFKGFLHVIYLSELNFTLPSLCIFFSQSTTQLIMENSYCPPVYIIRTKQIKGEENRGEIFQEGIAFAIRVVCTNSLHSLKELCKSGGAKTPKKLVLNFSLHATIPLQVIFHLNQLFKCLKCPAITLFFIFSSTFDDW